MKYINYFFYRAFAPTGAAQGMYQLQKVDTKNITCD